MIPDFTHHAFLVSGEGSVMLVHLHKELLLRGITVAGNPDVFEVVLDTLSIDDARALSERQLRKSFAEGPSIFLVSFNHMTHEAQNALLKVFEEPTPGSIFFLITPHAHTILPTLRSRLEMFTPTGEGGTPKRSIAEPFLKATPSERLKMLAPILEEKDKEAALLLFNEIETLLTGEYRDALGVSQALKDFEELRGYIHDRASSLKLILESMALLCPRVGDRSMN